jgi:hypothetical protein
VHRLGEWPLRCFPQLGQHRDVGKGRGGRSLKGKRDHSAFGGAGVESFCSEWEGERLRLWRRQAPKTHHHFNSSALLSSSLVSETSCVHFLGDQGAGIWWLDSHWGGPWDGSVAKSQQSDATEFARWPLRCAGSEERTVRLKGRGDSARTGLRRVRNSMMSSQVKRSSLLERWSVW